MIYGQRFRSAIASNLLHYWGMSEVVIVWLDRKPPATCFSSVLFLLKLLTLTSKASQV